MVDFSKRAVNVMVSPEQKTIYVASPLAGSVEKFKMFIMECIADSGPDLEKASDNMLFRYVLDVDKVPPIVPKENNSDYFNRLLSVTKPLDIHPTHIVSLRDAIHCMKHGIPLLSPDAERKYIRAGMNGEA
ncbi:hypothetical protein [Alistipes indistinctus]|uniref:Uncharacterized protein n=1 Tax=Alistipes indistinctus YIT 12060 TaxID=742725 RepID=G5HBE6_9BACT|nr:hypothetical protein [Alistipes indistinctus]EHB91912.1 hypothetical protein HMPREF9450_01961 [Alistipes indistinctus YIT 12060]UWN59643.1 hypothetical protein NQ495_01430 [Alistipes indistinctus YIT 12060]